MLRGGGCEVLPLFSWCCIAVVLSSGSFLIYHKCKNVIARDLFIQFFPALVVSLPMEWIAFSHRSKRDVLLRVV